MIRLTAHSIESALEAAESMPDVDRGTAGYITIYTLLDAARADNPEPEQYDELLNLLSFLLGRNELGKLNNELAISRINEPLQQDG